MEESEAERKKVGYTSSISILSHEKAQGPLFILRPAVYTHGTPLDISMFEQGSTCCPFDGRSIHHLPSCHVTWPCHGKLELWMVVVVLGGPARD